jgi:hypothetical protein
MKKIQYLLFVGMALVFITTSCQKPYTRDDILVTPSTGGSNDGGSGTGDGTLLSKFAITGTGINLVYTYAYNNSNQLTDFNLTSAVTGTTVLYKWRFFRDNTGKILQYSVKNNIQGYPDSVLYTLHYPAGSTNFDLATGQYSFSGLAVKDSVVFSLAAGKVMQYISYGAYGPNAPYESNASTAYVYDNAGNIIKTTDSENDGTGTMVRTGVFDYEYDSKVNPLQLGQEAFILEAARYFSKNNPLKVVSTDYTTSSAGVKSTDQYIFQYNSSNKPSTGYAVNPSNTTDTIHLAYTYR